MTTSAIDIYQAFLDEGSRLLMAREFDALADTMCYPNSMETRDGKVILTDRAMMAEAARAFRDFLEGLGASDYHRICDTALFEAEGDRITGTHVTYVLRGGRFAVEPYRNEMRLRLEGGAWRGDGLAATVLNATCTILSPAQLRASRETNA